MSRRETPDVWTGEAAGLATRSGAYMIDVLVAFVSYVVLMTVVEYAVALVSQDKLQAPTFDNSIESWGFLAFWFVYNAYWWSTDGKSPGKAITGVRVVCIDRDDVPIRRASLRSLLYQVLFAPIFAPPFVLLRRDRRALHDRLAKTRVVYDWGRRPARLPDRVVQRRERRRAQGQITAG
jgi:uncharacterized RDD family membrane protein YckC